MRELWECLYRLKQKTFVFKTLPHPVYLLPLFPPPPTVISDSVLLWRNKLYKILLNPPSVTYFPLDAINCTNIYNNMITATLAKSERD